MTLTKEQKKEIIEKGLQDMLSTKEIGRLLGGLSRQRVYQLMTQFNLQTPERKKKGYWKEQSENYKWLHRTVNSKDLTKAEKHELFEFFEERLPEVCPILNIPLVYGNEGVRQDNSASIDRLDPTKPYVVGNVCIVSWRANRIKNDGTLEEHKKLVQWWEGNLKH